MGRFILSLIVTLLCAQMGFSYGVAPQSQAELTKEEAQAAREIAGKFHQQMVETGSMLPLYDELFVADFVARYVQERKQEIALRQPRPILLVPGLEYQPKLLGQASVKDWKCLLAAANNFLYYTMSEGIKRLAQTLHEGKEPDAKDVEALFPVSVQQLFEPHPVLKNFLLKQGDGHPIGNVEEMHSTAALLEQANLLLQAQRQSRQLGGIAASKLVESVLRERGVLDPQLTIIDTETYGFPPSTRFVQIVTPGFYTLTIVQVNGQYRILEAIPFVG